MTADRRAAPFGAASLLGLAAAFGLPAMLLFLRPSELFPELPQAEQVMIGEGGWWATALAVLLIMFVAERRGLGSIDLRWPGMRSVFWGLLGSVVLIALFAATQLLLQLLGLGVSEAATLDFGQIPPWLILAMALRAGVVEEILFRGYAVTRLESLTGRTWVAALLSLAAFVVLHATSWSAGHLIFVAVAGGALTLLYVWKRNLSANIIAHTLVDVVGLMLARYAMVQG
ncbi:CPBP family intramembrane glutamic endopeptidase [Brevundimonas sp.]|uniref:CPBP family intramembrane glutamic endopeptidase n=1 Tax=Brevundimonas sp. TaxID=1871086 RepID=UPI0025E92B30|nr:CPBP family intramembrane glutamic endopeptidase [Brevundimonas sp.]